ncbi:uncharacterized protein LOC101203618 [Cucumis sativus]|uniref:RING-type domain-containing protein n=1 Tax=Cucumis sativus TaxID=3659 RepID=A0A0A0KSR5_CUCSA|nr:uncharacterized protein LOC101203618 [Cucumis sativus]XP_011655687.1 uncharacterized protein LOC101203618 [Cucumis sativus]XP_031741887.1 uncharacterized protein LOC101203618 [Cucumis sativus]KGN51934.1 hypothetical protein Csa_009161 [Cucumis sativus]
MGSLCCVAARPHGSNAASRDWSLGPHEPFWHTNTSFSPPPSRWDIQFQSEGLPHGWHDAVQLYGSSTSSNSKESRSWIRGNNHLYTHNSASDGAGLFLSSPSDISQGPQWTPPAIQEINIDGYETATKRDPSLRTFSFWPAAEGNSENPDSGSSTFSQSDSSETEPTVKLRSSSNWNFTSRRSFMSKPIHPLAIPMQTSSGEAFESTNLGFAEFDSSTPQRDNQRWSSASSSIDFADVSEPLESDFYFKSSCRSDSFRCGLCERFLSQRSPWSSRRIVRSTDMPVAGVLSCRHVFHAECLDQTTPKTCKSDPPCPLCLKHENDRSPEQRTNSRLRNANSLPRPRPSTSEDGPSRPWGCAQVGDCVEGALHAPPRNSMLFVNRNRSKNLSFKGNSSKEFPGKLRKSGSYSSRLVSARPFDQEFVGCSRTSAGPSMKR